MYDLYIANKNYSSWSLRPWVLMRVLEIGFAEHLVPFGDASGWAAYRELSPAGKVPCLGDGDVVVWDSLAIVEYLAEQHVGVWPADREARAWSRSAAAEMHSGFNELRSRCSMSCGIRVRLHEVPAGLERDVARLRALWSEGLHRFGGPFLGGAAFSAADAFFAPVAFRARTYGLALGEPAASYVKRLLDLPAMREWDRAALAETMREPAHDAEIASVGTVLEDLRSR
ncbi:MAG: glutathione S-transferase family protein [Steroidobacteraceae bacterium]